MTSILKVDEIQNTDGKTGIVITPDGTVTVPSVEFPEITGGDPDRIITSTKMSSYEEGTWTPRLDGYTGVTYTRQVGFYTKVGRLVLINFELDISSVGTYTTNSRIGGLPFRSGTSRTVPQSGFGSVMTALDATRDHQYFGVYNSGNDLFIYGKSGSPYNGDNHQAGRYSGAITYITNE